MIEWWSLFINDWRIFAGSLTVCVLICLPTLTLALERLDKKKIKRLEEVIETQQEIRRKEKRDKMNFNTWDFLNAQDDEFKSKSVTESQKKMKQKNQDKRRE